MKKLFSLLFVTLLVFSINLMGCEGVGNEDSTISPHVHDLIKINAVEATYDSVGNIEHYKCKSENCGLLFVDGEAKTQISLKDVVIPVKLRPITFITDELVYEFDDEPECLFYSNVNEIVLADVCIPNSTNARLNTGYAKGFWGLDYIYLKEDLLGDFVVEFNVDVTATYHFVFEIFVIEDDVYERRVTNFKIGNSKEIMLDYTHSDECAGKHQFVSGITAELEAGKHFLTLSLPDVFDDELVKSLFIHKFYYASLSKN